MKTARRKTRLSYLKCGGGKDDVNYDDALNLRKRKDSIG